MKLPNKLTQKKIFVYIFSLICICSAIISYIYRINLSNLFGPNEVNPFLLKYDILVKNGGVVSDLVTHWTYIQILRENIFNLFHYEMGVDTNLINYPLHNIIISQLYFLSDDIKNYLFFYFCFSLTIPYLFYLNLSVVFNKISKLTLILVSSIIFIFPTFQYTAIWGNNHITSLFFFLIGTLFHLKLRNTNYTKIKYFIISICSISLAAYTKQYYIFFFFFMFLEFFIKLKFKFFLNISFFTIILAIPGGLFLIANPLLFFGIKQEITNFSSSILISSSICFFYIFPFIIQYFVNNFNNLNKAFKKLINFKIAIISILIFLICLPFFYYQGGIGGGVIYKLFVIILDLRNIFFIFSLLGIYFIFFYARYNIYSIFLSITILCTFSTGFFIFQKYFEPMFLVIFLLYFNTNKIGECLKKNNFIIIIYFLSYYLINNYIYFFGV